MVQAIFLALSLASVAHAAPLAAGGVSSLPKPMITQTQKDDQPPHREFVTGISVIAAAAPIGRPQRLASSIAKAADPQPLELGSLSGSMLPMDRA